MFLNLLDANQQRLFVIAAQAVAEQDGKVADVERALLESVIAECEIDEIPPGMPLDDLLSALDESLGGELYARNAFLLELAGVAVIDGDAHPAELAVLTEICLRLGVTDETLTRYVQFAIAARDLIVQGRQLVATADEG
ncbi:MAG: hypothetical protein WKF96_08850 [Solirubrobacteraceae bacterium]